MLKVYFLPVIKLDNTETVAGIDLIHNALLLCAESPNIRTLIIDATPDEHTQLSAHATGVRDPTREELDLFNARPPMPTPDPDAAYVASILQSSPSSIPMPDIWKLLRIFGKRLGYHW